jgi:hypothetical protein
MADDKMNAATRHIPVVPGEPMPGEPPVDYSLDPNAPPVDIDAEGDEAPVAIDEMPEDLLSHKLTKPIPAHGEDILVLRWREPTGLDIEKAGNPITLEGVGLDRPRLSFDEKKMAAMISRLAAIPPSSVQKLAARDWNAIAFKVFRFFM